MLRIHLGAANTKMPVIHDIESEFTTVVLQGTAEVRRIMSTLEKVLMLMRTALMTVLVLDCLSRI